MLVTGSHMVDDSWMNEAATSGQAPADTGCEIG
jgi:hypothetical protein